MAHGRIRNVLPFGYSLSPHTTPTQFVYFRNECFNNILLHPLNLSISFNNETFYYDCKATATLSSVHFFSQFQALFHGDILVKAMEINFSTLLRNTEKINFSQVNKESPSLPIMAFS